MCLVDEQVRAPPEKLSPGLRGHLLRDCGVATITLQASANAIAVSEPLSPWAKRPTTGRSAVLLTTPSSCSTPRDSNFSATCVRSTSDGTSTSSLGRRAATSKASMVSVLPVPVGMTTVAGTGEFVVQYPRTECRAPR
jgi:hypothetical protein